MLFFLIQRINSFFASSRWMAVDVYVCTWCSISLAFFLLLIQFNRNRLRWQNFKYVINCLIVEAKGAGLSLSSSCFWNDESDGLEVVVWENKQMHCVATIYVTAI